MFLNLDQKNQENIAAIDDNNGRITYGELNEFSENFYNKIGSRTLIFIISKNSIGAMAGYIAALTARVVPLMLGYKIDRQLLENLISIYKPEYIWLPDNYNFKDSYKSIYSDLGYCLIKTSSLIAELNPDLSLLLPTSGSTGSPKLVRHSYRNVEQNAANVSSLFNLNKDQKAIAILPIHYTMGLSVVTSHLYAGATVLLCNQNLTDKEFWSFIKNNKATSLTGVPYSYEVLDRIRFFRMDLPDLQIISQGGGKMRSELFQSCADYALKTNRMFIATYGQTEGTARMAYLPPEMAQTKNCSIGKAIPGGKLYLVDDELNEIKDQEVSGQLVYEGPNVTLGYASDINDLTKGDDNGGILYTGDIAHRDIDGYYYIDGRINRFLKLYGNRISLDESEHLIRSKFNIDCICEGDDQVMKVIITKDDLKEKVLDFLMQKTNLFQDALEINVVDKILRSEVGKPIYL